MFQGWGIEKKMYNELAELKKPLINIISQKYNIKKGAILSLRIDLDCSTLELLSCREIPFQVEDDELKIRLNRMEKTTATFYNDTEKDHTFTRYKYYFDIDY